ILACPCPLRQQANAQDRFIERTQSKVAGLERCLTGNNHMGEKKRLQVNDHWMFAGSNDIFAVHICRVQRVEESKILTLALVKAHNFILRCTGSGLYKFSPPVLAAIEQFQNAERRLRTSLV